MNSLHKFLSGIALMEITFLMTDTNNRHSTGGGNEKNIKIRKN